MKRMTIAWLAAAALFLLFLLLGTFVPGMLGLSTRVLWVMRATLWLLGLGAAILLLLILRARAKAMPEPAASDDEVDGAVRAARTRLAASGGAKANLGKRPLIVVLGPAGSAKTTSVVRSGLDPELLAGEVHRADTVVPTSGVNLWLASDLVLVEAGGRLTTDAPRWVRLLRHLRPARLGAAFSRSAQAPRMAIVCIGCDEFLKPGAGEALAATSQRLRARLTEMAQQMGIRLPVYVLFTKADRLPYFEDYVRSITRDEAAEVLGATLPVPPPVDAGHYAEQTSTRLDAAFARIVHALAMKRLDVLPRESTEEVRAGAYEFPRELRKVSSAAVQFLMDLCRPSQLGTSPFLRGFYFTGVRPLVVSDAGAAPAAPAASSAMDATSVFDPRALMGQQQAAPAHGSRRVPDWTFLPRVFRDVIMKDDVARAVTAGGRRVNMMRRILVGGLSAAAALLLFGVVVSWISNGRLIRAGRAAALSVESVNLSRPAMPAMEDLRRLDSLRTFLAELREDREEGAPLRRSFGLHQGNRVFDTLRPLYFQRLDGMLRGRAQDALVASVRGVSAASSYDSTYNALKAYLITTSHPQESTPEFLTPVMTAPFSGQGSDSLPQVLTAQFDFYANELPHGNPYDARAEDPLVQSTCRFLSGFAETDRFYQALLTQADRNAQMPRLPASPQHLQVDAQVRPAYTPEGHDFVQRSLANPESLLAHESWVCEQTVAPGDRATLARALQDRYIQDYITTWQSLLARSSVVGYGSAQEGSVRLRILADNLSPLLQLFAVTSTATNIDSARIGRHFQPVRAVVPPNTTGSFIADGNRGYTQALMSLQGALDQLGRAVGSARQTAAMQAGANLDGARAQVAQIASGFNFEAGAAGTAEAVRRLMLQPLASAESLLDDLPRAELNAKGTAFCQAAAPLFRKYPFSRSASEEASIDEVITVLQPGTGAVATFIAQDLAGIVQRRGNQYGAAPGAQPAPTGAFIASINVLTDASRALFTDDGAGPEVTFVFRPHTTEQLPEITVSIDGMTHTFTRQNPSSRDFQWIGRRAQSVRISAANGFELTGEGIWGLYRVFGRASWERRAPGDYLLRWQLSSGTLTAELRFAQPVAIFDPGFLNRVGCVSRIAG
jgi:type VI secretion system protein ImpL